MAAFVAILEEAGVPAGAVNLVLGRGSRLGPALLRAPASAVTFTSGNVAGKAVAAAAVDHGLKYQLELGGNNPVLVLADADLDLVTRELTAGAIGSTGQKCTATRRVFVVDERFDEVSERLQAVVRGQGARPGPRPGDRRRAARHRRGPRRLRGERRRRRRARRRRSPLRHGAGRGLLRPTCG